MSFLLSPEKGTKDHAKDETLTQSPTSNTSSNACDVDERDMTSSESSFETIEYRGLENPRVSSSVSFFFFFFLSCSRGTQRQHFSKIIKRCLLCSQVVSWSYLFKLTQYDLFDRWSWKCKPLQKVLANRILFPVFTSCCWLYEPCQFTLFLIFNKMLAIRKWKELVKFPVLWNIELTFRPKKTLDFLWN